ncbi:hypothetical protein JOH51_004722 [Rhizobium leguminosarum]|nr:hypothetical protein [Rhizobium leguminosarum]
MLDLDATDDPLHGHQEGPVLSRVLQIATAICRFTSSVAATCLSAKLRRSNIDASAGSVAEIDRIVGQIRDRWPNVRIILRADSGFARDELMDWCETNKVDTAIESFGGNAVGARPAASAVTAEFACGDADLERIDADRLSDIFELGVAEIADGEIEPRLDLTVGVLGQANGARRCNALQTRGDVDAVAHQVAVAFLDRLMPIRNSMRRS